MIKVYDFSMNIYTPETIYQKIVGLDTQVISFSDDSFGILYWIDIIQGEAGFTRVYPNGDCYGCATNCSRCSNSSFCTKCLANSFLNTTNGCSQFCPDGYYPNSTNWICSLCSTNCSTCVNSTYCTSCPLNSYLLNGVCISTCPTRYFANTTNRACENCLANCQNCINSTTCSLCDIGLFWNGNGCVNQCPITFWGNSTSRACFSCPENCEYCASSTVCTSCSSHFYLFRSACFPQHQPGGNLTSSCESDKVIVPQIFNGNMAYPYNKEITLLSSYEITSLCFTEEGSFLFFIWECLNMNSNTNCTDLFLESSPNNVTIAANSFSIGDQVNVTYIVSTGFKNFSQSKLLNFQNSQTLVVELSCNTAASQCIISKSSKEFEFTALIANNTTSMNYKWTSQPEIKMVFYQNKMRILQGLDTFSGASLKISLN